MKDKDVFDEISSIKNIMERSTRFISLSGLSGVMAGVYALIGAGMAYKLIPIYSNQSFYEVFVNHNDHIGIAYDGPGFFATFITLGLSVLLLSIATGVWLTIRKAHRKGQTVWNQSSRAFLKKGALPLLAGGSFILILLSQGYYGIIAPACLLFYGLALAAASQYTYGDVKWLGLCEIALGLIAMIFPLYGLLFWALGFGVLHILYGTIMYFKYDRENSAH
jgi:hypothetical protein